MRIGISVSSSYPNIEQRTGARWMVERARASRYAGLDSLFIGDHHVTPASYYQNSPMLGRLLAEWGASPAGALYLLPLWNPVLLAEQVATLASIAQGPFILQCGLGGDRRQSFGMGVDPARRVGMFETALETLRALWRGEEITLESYWPIRRARIAPLPPERVDVWIGAQAPVAIERAARLGDGWLAAPSLTAEEARTALDLYREACARHGRAAGIAALRRDIYIDESAEDARRVVEPYLAAGYRGFPPESLVFGSVEEVAAQLRGFAEMGYDEIVVRNLSARQDECLATLERLGEVRRLLA